MDEVACVGEDIPDSACDNKETTALDNTEAPDSDVIVGTTDPFDGLS